MYYIKYYTVRAVGTYFIAWKCLLICVFILGARCVLLDILELFSF